MHRRIGPPPGVLLRAMIGLEYITFILPFAACMVEFVDSGGRTLPPMYWNSSNPIFSNPNSEININLSDSIDVICPQYSTTSDVSNREYYVIYFVSRQEYDACTIYDTKNVTLVLNCSKPTESPPLMFTLWVESFQPFLKMPDFKPGKYYLITTSTGSHNGLDNQYHGACKTRNMRLVMNVCCGATDQTTRAPTQNPNPTAAPNTTKNTPTPTTRRTTTTPTPKTTTTPRPTTHAPTTTSQRATTTPKPPPPETRFPTQPSDPSKDRIVIDATGAGKNTGLINSARTLVYSHLLLTLSSCIVTLFVLLVR